MRGAKQELAPLFYFLLDITPEFQTNKTINHISHYESGRLSYVGRLNYAYADKYLLEAAFRVDGSTKFAPDQRWGFFPSVSAGWRISSEPFFSENIKFIDYIKLRGSIATLGNDAIGGWLWRR